MSTKLPKKTLHLKQFLLRQEVLKLYRDIFRTLRHVKDEANKAEMADWARIDFKNNMHETDEATIKNMLHYGKKSLKDLQQLTGYTKKS
ncbi:LYR motif-containing protein 2 [Trichoplusia ni]|uniref:LYR motif-containing protein 2 n=1 Tax=Trichoplusia ni TaxID=7111 RepID=A0A7E5WU75_TRINI|nr:LYR motif-containing protein 2 [Trichoplusia ni]